MSHPKVTIGIPCYNAERWLKQCIESALEQTWPNKEVIVVDNGSSDGSPEIMQLFKERIRSVTISQRGANYARNEILRLASGDWIQYLDADDYLLPDKISRQMEEAMEFAPSTLEPPGQLKVLYSPVLIQEKGITSPSEINGQFDLPAQWIAWQLPQTGACLWPKGTLEKLGGWNLTMPCCQEHELYLRAIQANTPFQFTPTARAVYRIWSDETLCRKDPVLVITIRSRLIEQMLHWLEDNGALSQSHRLVAGRAFFEMARTWARHDINQATNYLNEKRALGLLNLHGPAAPPAYRLCFRLFGFRNAELLAKLLRADKSASRGAS